MSQNQGQGQQQWTEVSGGSNNPRWEPHKILPFDPNNPANFIQGYWKDSLERNGREGPFEVLVVSVLKPDRTFEDWDIAATAVIEDAIKDISMGTYICIQYCGPTVFKNGRTGRMYKVFKDDNAIPFQQLGGVVKQKTVAAPMPPQGQPPVWNQQQVAPIPPTNYQQQNPVPAAPVFNQPPQTGNPAPTYQQPPVFNTPPQSYPPPPVQNQPYVAPTPGQTYTAHQYVPPAQNTPPPPQLNQPPQTNPNVVGGQNVFVNPNNDLPLPF